MQNKAFTLVEMLVALAVGAIVIMATYASYEMVDTQYKKNIDVANMHTSGRSIMQMIERDVRMAGFEYRHTSGTNKGKKAFSSGITTPLDITDSGNKCCDEVKVIYDYFNEDNSTVKRIQIHYFTKEHNTPKKGKRYRLYKQVNDILPIAKIRSAEVMADFVEDLQLVNIENDLTLYIGTNGIKTYSVQKITNGISVNDISHLTNLEKVGGAGTNGSITISPDLSSQFIKNNKIVGNKNISNGLMFIGTCSQRGYLFDLIGGPIEQYNSMGCARTAAFDHSSGLLYAGSGSDIRIYDISKKYGAGVAIGKISGNPDSLAINSNGLMFLGYCSTYSFIYDIYTKKMHRLTGMGCARTAAFDRSSGLLYVGSGSDIRIYDTSKNRGNIVAIGKISGHNPDSLAISSDGLMFLGYCSTYSFIYDIYTKKMHRLTGMGCAKTSVFKNKRTGQESLVAIRLSLRSEKEHSNNSKKYKYDLADYKFEANDKYKHDVFSTTVLVRNLAL
jgi:prepilin-type N-terminal cleavage/methylation domain-containing protein